MRIALLSYEYPPETGFGGIGTYTWYQARALAKLGHEVHVLAGALESNGLLSRREEGVYVHRYRATGRWMRAFGRLSKWRLWWTTNRLENGLSMRRALEQLRRRHSFDVLEMPECGAEGLLINDSVGLPTVVKLHSPAELIMPFYDVRRVDHVLCSILERRGIRRAGRLLSASAFLAGAVRRELQVRRDIAVVPNGIDLSLFDATDQVNARSKFGIPADRPMIFFAGRMERRKGIHVCSEVVTRILQRHKVAMVFAGSDLFGHLEKEILPGLRDRPLKGSVHYLGKLGRVDVGSCLRQTDIFFLPSLWENCPYSCLEAMAAGRAIVSSDAGGLPELIEDGVTGLTAPNGDAGAYVEALERLLDDGALRQRLGAAARNRVEERFTDIDIAERTVAEYARLTSTTPR
jgi:glycosyltransferase involved in cell wall biosynthesis